MKRLYVSLTDEQVKRVKERAAKTGVIVAEQIRRALSNSLALEWMSDAMGDKQAHHVEILEKFATALNSTWSPDLAWKTIRYPSVPELPETWKPILEQISQLYHALSNTPEAREAFQAFSTAYETGKTPPAFNAACKLCRREEMLQ